MDPILMLITILVCIASPAVIGLISSVPEGTLKMLLHPRHLRMELKAKKKLKAIEASQRRVAQLEIEHKESLKEAQKAQNVELDYFDYQLFELERPIILRELTQKATNVVNRQLPKEEAMSVLTELSEAYHRAAKFKDVEPSVQGTIDAIQKLAHEVESHRRMLIGIELHKQKIAHQKKKEIADKKHKEACAPVPYVPEGRHVLDLMEAVNDPSVSASKTLAAMRRFLGDEWDEIAFYFLEDEATIAQISELVEAKAGRAYAKPSWDAEIREEVHNRILSSDNPEEYAKILGID